MVASSDDVVVPEEEEESLLEEMEVKTAGGAEETGSESPMAVDGEDVKFAITLNGVKGNGFLYRNQPADKEGSCSPINCLSQLYNVGSYLTLGSWSTLVTSQGQY